MIRTLLVYLFFVLSTGAFAQLSKQYPNMVLNLETAGQHYLEVEYTGEASSLEAALQKQFSDAQKQQISWTKAGGSLSLKGIQYPALVPGSKGYALKVERVKNQPTWRFSVHNDTANMLNTYAFLGRRFAEIIQEAVDRSLDVKYEQAAEVYETPYLSAGLPGEESISSRLYFFTTQNHDSVFVHITNALTAMADSGYSIRLGKDSLVYIDNLHIPALGLEKPFSFIVKLEYLGQTSFMFSLWAAYYDPNDRERDDTYNYTVRYADLNKRLRWLLKWTM
ncbi:MAG: hypothetical protein EP332_08795 [Bacteroidetes bacterium]|nr:MAG: hypothetical protein EP332_08795 [Bacteroidota bacterium]